MLQFTTYTVQEFTKNMVQSTKNVQNGTYSEISVQTEDVQILYVPCGSVNLSTHSGKEYVKTKIILKPAQFLKH